MIKDSKLIGTKIKVPFGWQKFKVGELFDVMRGSRLVVVNREAGSYPFVTAGFENRGVSDYINNPEQTLFAGNVITIDMFGNVFYRFNSFKADDNILVLTSLFTDDIDSLMYLETILQKATSSRFNYGHQFRQKNFYELSIMLPVTADNQPDFEWMSAYVKAVKADYLEQKELSNRNEIEAYLSAGNTDSMDVTDDDRQFLRDFEKLPRRKFKVGELFDKLSSKFLGSGNKFDHVYRTCTDEHNIPILYAKYNDNGIMYWAKQGDFEIHSNCIGVIYNGAVSAGRVFAQEVPTGVLAESYLLSLKHYNVNHNTNLYLSTALQKVLFAKYSREYLATWNKVQFDEIELPVIDSSQIDVQSIEKYMQIQSKPLIDKVAKTLAPVGGGHF